MRENMKGRERCSRPLASLWKFRHLRCGQSRLRRKQECYVDEELGFVRTFSNLLNRRLCFRRILDWMQLNFRLTFDFPFC
jgi:hypothetical protein